MGGKEESRSRRSWRLKARRKEINERGRKGIIRSRRGGKKEGTRKKGEKQKRQERNKEEKAKKRGRRIEDNHVREKKRRVEKK